MVFMFRSVGQLPGTHFMARPAAQVTGWVWFSFVGLLRMLVFATTVKMRVA